MQKVIDKTTVLVYNIIVVMSEDITGYMQTYRSGHNGADSKSVCGQPHVGSNPTVSATSEQTLYRLLRRLFMPVAKETSFVRSPMPTVSKVRGAHSSPYHPAIILAGNTV